MFVVSSVIDLFGYKKSIR